MNEIRISIFSGTSKLYVEGSAAAYQRWKFKAVLADIINKPTFYPSYKSNHIYYTIAIDIKFPLDQLNRRNIKRILTYILL